MESIDCGAVDAYLDGLLPARPAHFAEMERYAAEKSFPVIGPQAGRVLSQFAALVGGRRFFEMGSGFGYSACWLLEGAPGARIICTDTSPENETLARKWLTQGGCWDRVDFRVADALAELKKSEHDYDLIYNDVDKEAYPDVFKLALERLAPGGLLISDNVLWKGRVADRSITDAATCAIREYNRLMFETADVQSVIIPVRDGLGVTRCVSE